MDFYLRLTLLVKVLLDIPCTSARYGSITYGLLCLVPTVPAFLKFMLRFVLFNITTASMNILLDFIQECECGKPMSTFIMLFK